MNMREEIKLKDYLKGKRNYSVNMAEDYVSWKDEYHKIVYRNDVPYVQIRELLSLSEIRRMVQAINEKDNKQNLKGQFVTINGNSYYIIGIGGESIKASKNGDEAEFFRYVGSRRKNIESQELLEKLYSICEE